MQQDFFYSKKDTPSGSILMQMQPKILGRYFNSTISLLPSTVTLYLPG